MLNTKSAHIYIKYIKCDDRCFIEVITNSKKKHIREVIEIKNRETWNVFAKSFQYLKVSNTHSCNVRHFDYDVYFLICPKMRKLISLKTIFTSHDCFCRFKIFLLSF